jgi:hypothetical protein
MGTNLAKSDAKGQKAAGWSAAAVLTLTRVWNAGGFDEKGPIEPTFLFQRAAIAEPLDFGLRQIQQAAENILGIAAKQRGCALHLARGA